MSIIDFAVKLNEYYVLILNQTQQVNYLSGIKNTMQNGKTNQLGLMHLEKVPSMKHRLYTDKEQFRV